MFSPAFLYLLEPFVNTLALTPLLMDWLDSNGPGLFWYKGEEYDHLLTKASQLWAHWSFFFGLYLISFITPFFPAGSSFSGLHRGITSWSPK
jgi:hypothetical protein